MKDHKKRLDKLEDVAGDGGQHTITIRYADDWEEPPREDVVLPAPDLKEDVVITVCYVENWRNEELQAKD